MYFLFIKNVNKYFIELINIKINKWKEVFVSFYILRNIEFCWYYEIFEWKII